MNYTYFCGVVAGQEWQIRASPNMPNVTVKWITPTGLVCYSLGGRPFLPSIHHMPVETFVALFRCVDTDNMFTLMFLQTDGSLRYQIQKYYPNSWKSHTIAEFRPYKNARLARRVLETYEALGVELSYSGKKMA